MTRARPKGQICAVEGCPEPRRRREWCALHYQRWTRTGSPTGSNRADAEARFWPRVDRSGGPDACWPWMGYREAFGHGRFWADGRHQLAHRVAWAFTNGPIAPDVALCHRCDNPPCCNPAHLFEGTRADNIADMVAKGRHRNGDIRGERNPNAKLTEAAVRQIRADRAAGALLREIAERHGITEGLVSMIARGLLWSDPPATGTGGTGS
jgi:hypothetical protein